ncbi:hypothetical protein BOX15_Mlig016025g3 [Macrostomum lignano]|uniref:EF-hand domain-containing protein n=2 Tax=Macrostomum lignano TaxID=282301 RepID=A0A267GFQ6_9PLAT|nr:hypothetical protein BOX15_Mlig016025g3 [Macrostomum lignano]
MADFLTAFESIDTDFSGEITREELEAYCRKQNFDEKFVQKWLNLFDADNSGTISIDEYCDTLGLRPNTEYMEKVQVQRSNAAPADDDWMNGVKVIAVAEALDEDLMRLIVRLAREAQAKHTVEKDIAMYIKDRLDEKDQAAWQHLESSLGRWHIIAPRSTKTIDISRLKKAINFNARQHTPDPK